MESIDSYPGGKGGAGVYQTLINQIPPHDCYIAPFAGHDAVGRYMRTSRESVFCDLDGDELRVLRRHVRRLNASYHVTDGVAYLRHRFEIDRLSSDLGSPKSAASAIVANSGGVTRLHHQSPNEERTFVFADPPYPFESRRDETSKLYRFETSDDLHEQLIDTLDRLPSHVAAMVTTLPNDLYHDRLYHWRRFDMLVATRGGPATEWVFCNYDRPNVLHDYRYLGCDKREREKLDRRSRRLAAKYSDLPLIELRKLAADLTDEIDNRDRTSPELASTAVDAEYGDAAGSRA